MVLIRYIFIAIVAISLITSGLAWADDTKNANSVLGRTVCLNYLGDDFEDMNWSYDYQNHISSNRLWRSGSCDGEPELLARVPTPEKGKNGSTGALEIRTNTIEQFDDGTSTGHFGMEKLLTVEYEQILKRKLTCVDQPVFIIRVWLPPFDQWLRKDPEQDLYEIGFRHEVFPKKGSKYYPSIFLHHERSLPKPCFIVRIFPMDTGEQNRDILVKYIDQQYWWTLAIAFDADGVDHYYAHPGVDIPTEKDEIFNTGIFRNENGIETPSMDYVFYSFFHLGYPETGNVSPRFVIDDYEVWVVNQAK